MKEIFDILKGQKQASDGLNGILSDVVDELSVVDNFIRNLDPLDLEDYDPEEIQDIRRSLKYVEETVTLLLNNMDPESAIPTQPEGN